MNKAKKVQFRAGLMSEDVPEIVIMGCIEAESEDFFGQVPSTSMQVMSQLRYVDSTKKVRVIINSPGGDYETGLAIQGLLQNRRGEVETVGIGIVGSIATIVLMAGTKGKRYLAADAFLQIHLPWAGAVGNADDLRDTADTLEMLGMQLANIYTKVIEGNGKLINDSFEETYNAIVAIMQEDQPMPAVQALELGLIDGISNATPAFAGENPALIEELGEMLEGKVNNKRYSQVFNKIKSENMEFFEKLFGKPKAEVKPATQEAGTVTLTAEEQKAVQDQIEADRKAEAERIAALEAEKKALEDKLAAIEAANKTALDAANAEITTLRAGVKAMPAGAENAAQTMASIDITKTDPKQAFSDEKMKVISGFSNSLMGILNIQTPDLS